MTEITTHYPLHENDPNDYIMVRESNDLVTLNFKEKELFNPKNKLQEHPVSRQVVDCVQAVRDFTTTPIRINSTYRNYIPSGAGVVGAVSTSPHMLAQAIDFSFIGDKEKVEALYVSIRYDFDNKGPLFQTLWDLGCRGFGSYDTFIHLDTTVSEWYEPFRKKRTITYLGKRFARWNKMKLLRNRPVAGMLALNPVVTIIETATGVVEGFVEEIMDSEDRGQDINAWNGGVFVAIVGGTILLFILPFLVLKR